MAQQAQPHAPIRFDRHVDLLVAGAGAGGMSAALVASIEGLDVLICEKSQQVGGTASTAAGTLWIPGNTLSRDAGFSDTKEEAQLYLEALMGDTPQGALRKVFLDKCEQAIGYFTEKTDVQFVPCGYNPDYVTRLPGAAREGRAVIPAAFDGRLFLKKHLERVRPPIPEMMVFKGMMVSKADMPHLLGRFKSWTGFVYASKLFLRYATDLFRYSRGTRLVMGNALVARLYYSLLELNAAFLFGAGIEELIMDGSAVVGAVVATGQSRVRIGARRGVILATGGFAHHAATRDEFMPSAGRRLSFASEMNTGDGVSIGRQIGALVSKEHNETSAIWTPVSLTRRANGTQGLFPHFGMDRAKPGIIAVNKSGRRFLNEAISYHHFVLEMFRTQSAAEQPCYLICDREFIRKYGLGVIRPGSGDIGRYVTDGYLVSAETVAGLAAAIGIDADALEATVHRFNGLARTGIDPDFHKGETDFERFYGDPGKQPNPCLGGILAAPYYALAIWPAETACTVGLATDADARVIGRDRKPITGLYACGNDMASIMDGEDPGPGATLGPATVFGYLAARAAARHS